MFELIMNGAQFATIVTLVVGAFTLIGVMVGHWVQYKLGKQKAELDRVTFLVNELQESAKNASDRADAAAVRMDGMDGKIHELRKALGESRDENAKMKALLAETMEKVESAEDYILELLAWGEDGAPPPPPVRRIKTKPTGPGGLTHIEGGE
ncbi:hypothetical protein [Trueperella pyogenes]|uniref:hypothetical protein n=1 Tax=Trueperella pyogenes TaxID=1661 RepID=UPI00324F1370